MARCCRAVLSAPSLIMRDSHESVHDIENRPFEFLRLALECNCGGECRILMNCVAGQITDSNSFTQRIEMRRETLALMRVANEISNAGFECWQHEIEK